MLGYVPTPTVCPQHRSQLLLYNAKNAPKKIEIQLFPMSNFFPEAELSSTPHPRCWGTPRVSATPLATACLAPELLRRTGDSRSSNTSHWERFTARQKEQNPPSSWNNPRPNTGVKLGKGCGHCRTVWRAPLILGGGPASAPWLFSCTHISLWLQLGVWCHLKKPYGISSNTFLFLAAFVCLELFLWSRPGKTAEKGAASLCSHLRPKSNDL